MKKITIVLISIAMGVSAAPAQTVNNPCIATGTNTICLTNPSVSLGPVTLSNPMVCVSNTVSASTTQTSNPGSTRSDITYANCPTAAVTNSIQATIISNWWTASGPGGFTATGSGLSAMFTPTNSGGGTITFNTQWSSPAPCSASGTSSTSTNYTILASQFQTNCLQEGSVRLDGVTFDPSNIVCVGASITASTSTILSNALLQVVDTNNCSPAATNQVAPIILTNYWMVTGLAVDPPNGSGLSATFSTTNKGNGTITFFCQWTSPPPCTASGTATTNAAFTIRCPTQTATAGAAQCGPARYGATINYAYDCADKWWILENVNWGATTTCSPGRPTITQTTNAFQMSGNSVSDDITNSGNPANVADCTDITDQSISLGPTQATVGVCTYANTQTITVTRTNAPMIPAHGTVVTSSAGATARCTW